MALRPLTKRHHNLCMICLEETRLRQAYDAALAAWEKNRRFLINGVYSIDYRSRVRRELLDARFTAANDLYDHCVKCPHCKISRRSSFDPVG